MRMAQNSSYDLIVLGAGPGGYVAAIRASQLGMKVAVVEKSKNLGGTCLNIGCIPSKSLLESSELYYTSKMHLNDHGIMTGNVKFDLQRMMERKTEVVSQLVSGVSSLLKAKSVDVYTGFAHIVPSGAGKARRVEVSRRGAKKQALSGKRILIATGSIPVELPFLPFDFRDIVTSTEALSFDNVPKKLVVIGAGAIGLELGSVWSRLGSEVTVVELLPQIMPGWDLQISRRMNQLLKKQGMNLIVSTKVLGCEKKKTGLQVLAEGKDGTTQRFLANKVLVSVGRKPLHEGVGIAENSIEIEEGSGFIKVDEQYKTSAENIYAIGDVIRGPMLAHKAEEEGVVCVENIAGIPSELNYQAIPGVVYTDPEAASVGKTEEQLSEEKTEYKKGTFSFKANGRALALGSTDGFVKVLAESRTDEVLGVHILGPRASELISEAVTVIEYGGSSEDIARTIHAHPTLPEVVKEAALAVEGRSIHSL
jgi:dihydrolipoamide dehydrogenase